jgi:thioredoxin reductase (NADPH)
MTNTEIITTDALVIGAGPVGLFQAFQLGLQGIHTHVVDALSEAGGQCVELYPDKLIYDIPGVAQCTGRELTQNLLQQLAPFKPTFHFNQLVSQVERQADGRWLVVTAEQHFLTRTLFIAAGVGAFVPKELKLEGLAAFLGHQLFYGTVPVQASAGQHVVIVGGDDTAVARAIALATEGPHQAQSVTLLHRRDVFKACDEDLRQLAILRAALKINFQAGQISGINTQDSGLRSVTIITPEDQTLTLPLDTLMVCMGVSPKLGTLPQWGLAMERKQLTVDAASMATSEPGIYAIGDINTYPGKKKLIVCGFHEATLAAFAAAKYLNPQTSEVLQYTSSSTLLQQRLGVSAPTEANPVIDVKATSKKQANDALHHKPYEDVQAMLTGTLFVAFGIVLFGQAGLLTGGTPGVAFLIHYATGWNFGLVLFLVNVPFYALAWQRMGRVFTMKTCAAVGLLSTYINLLPKLVHFETVTPAFAAVMGGLMMGVGILMLFRHRASLGGFNVLALFMQDRFGWRAGRIQMVLDAAILTCSFTLVAWPLVALSVLGAVVLNQILITNHRTERYVAL